MRSLSVSAFSLSFLASACASLLAHSGQIPIEISYEIEVELDTQEHLLEGEERETWLDEGFATYSKLHGA